MSYSLSFSQRSGLSLMSTSSLAKKMAQMYEQGAKSQVWRWNEAVNSNHS